MCVCVFLSTQTLSERLEAWDLRVILVQSFCSEVGKDADAKLVISFYNKQNKILCNVMLFLIWG